ncbi:hypothetical protein LRAMOSA11113 [Lichtheimia ramosa]|uniref:Heterokaryon incompatibility domain-containing protein n=1 Tax=Lichtheimia ramosa TaxID=688394 RepID=A0A077WV92_9FUNG|nr:hypothetical protein LRAMOSA11113 [Lichtheimia ramosa]
MTCDTDDPYKINITVENAKSNKRKVFFEKGLGALLADEHFLLLYVPDNGAKMQVIRPVSDSYHRKRIIQRINEAKHIPSFYYALSHLWGLTDDNRYHWNDISEYVIDEQGQPVKPVSMRPEKRDTLLSMLKDHPDSYWWIDVLCARTDTPLDIMGDIYSCCLECIAMIDCDPGLIPELNTMKDMRANLDEYRWAFNNRYDHAPSKQFTENNTLLMDVLSTLMQSKWWHRVWTWQEMGLPFGDVRLMAETGSHQPISNTITVDDLRQFDYIVGKLTDIYHKKRLRRLNPKQKDALGNAEAIYDWLKEIQSARNSNESRLGKRMSSLRLFFLIKSLGRSTRCCMDPADYVYGVLGIFQMKIPRMADPNEVWKTFLAKLEEYLKNMYGNAISRPRIIDRARHGDLRKARNMAHVYKGLLTDNPFGN